MNRLVLRSLLFISLAASIVLVSSSSSISRAAETSDSTRDSGLPYSVVESDVDTRIHIESATVGGHEVEVVHLPDGQQFSIPVDQDLEKIRGQGLTNEEVAEAREEAREALELTLQGVLSDDFNGQMIVNADGTAESLVPSKDGQLLRAKNMFKSVFEFNHSLYRPAPKGLTPLAKIKRFSQMVWQFVFIETIHAGIEYYKQFRRVAPRFNEFGVAIDFKIEPQIFVAKFNPTKRFKATSHNWAAYLEVAYSHKQRRVLMHTRYRKEKGSGGLGAPALKAEFKIFESDGTTTPYRGKAWYPISPPIASFVLDSSDHYFAQGITIGFNSGDLIPFSTLTNTFTDFVQVQKIDFAEVSHATSDAFAKAAYHVKHVHPGRTCFDLFR